MHTSVSTASSWSGLLFDGYSRFCYLNLVFLPNFIPIPKACKRYIAQDFSNSPLSLATYHYFRIKRVEISTNLELYLSRR